MKIKIYDGLIDKYNIIEFQEGINEKESHKNFIEKMKEIYKISIRDLNKRFSIIEEIK